MARSQKAYVDFATSNVRRAPVPTFVSGAKILWTGTLCPIAGTAFKLTARSYDDSFDMGLHVDPVAVGDCDDWRRCIEAGFKELLARGRPVTRCRPRGRLSRWLSVALSLAARPLAVG